MPRQTPIVLPALSWQKKVKGTRSLAKGVVSLGLFSPCGGLGQLEALCNSEEQQLNNTIIS